MKFAVIGSLGWAGSRHVKALREMGQEIVALVDPGPGCAEQAAAVGAKPSPPSTTSTSTPSTPPPRSTPS